MYELHIIATWLHVVSAIYWIGAILFILTVLGPVVRTRPSSVALPIMSEVQARVRRFVLAAIIVFIATGLFNMHYRGLMDMYLLFNSTYGMILLVKMVPVTVIFVIYFTAPLMLKRLSPESKGACCEVEGGQKPVGRIFAILHLIALACGLLIVFLGIRLGG